MRVQLADLLIWVNAKSYFPRVYLRQVREVEVATKAATIRLCLLTKENK